jgi:hypothetical protein
LLLCVPISNFNCSLYASGKLLPFGGQPLAVASSLATYLLLQLTEYVRVRMTIYWAVIEMSNVLLTFTNTA